MTLPDPVRTLPARFATEGALPAGRAVGREAHDGWFRTSVREAPDDPDTPAPHDRAMEEVQALSDGKRRARS